MSKKETKENMKKKLNDDEYLTSVTRKLFESADKNHNGTIEMKELKACMISVAQGLKLEKPKEEVVKQEFYKLDCDKNKLIDFNEFKSFVKQNMLKVIENMPDD